MTQQYPLTVYFDASCPLCNTEMQAIKTHDDNQRLILVDCSATDFDDSPYQADGITRQAMMDCLHVCDPNGVWIKGVSSFELLYRTVGITTIAKFWGSKFTRPITERIYPWVARHRQLISRTGLPILFKLWAEYEARRSYKRSRQCHEDKCSL